jgi:hypothetical protein
MADGSRICETSPLQRGSAGRAVLLVVVVGNDFLVLALIVHPRRVAHQHLGELLLHDIADVQQGVPPHEQAMLERGGAEAIESQSALQWMEGCSSGSRSLPAKPRVSELGLPDHPPHNTPL